MLVVFIIFVVNFITMNIKKLEGEIWVKIPLTGYPEYRVSNFGRVYSNYSDGLMTQRKNHKGYPRVELSYCAESKHIFVHKLVAMAFLTNPKGYNQINHKDGVKTNNHVSNLEWCNQSMNKKHSFQIGLESNKGQDHPQSKLTTNDVLSIRKMFHEDGYTRRMLATEFCIKPTTVKSIILRQSWKHI